MKKILLLILSITTTLLLFAQTSPDCSIMKQGSFKYLDIPDTTAYFTINKEEHIEYHEGRKYLIKSELTWVNDCQYKMKMLSNTIPDFPFHAGDVMTVTITRVEDNIIYFTAEVKGSKWPGRVRKMPE
jgi:hypothetical protein